MMILSKMRWDYPQQKTAPAVGRFFANALFERLRARLRGYLRAIKIVSHETSKHSLCEILKSAARRRRY